jgi:hypothetical protein
MERDDAEQFYLNMWFDLLSYTNYSSRDSIFHLNQKLEV